MNKRRSRNLRNNRRQALIDKPGKGELELEVGIAALGLAYERQARIGPFFADFLLKRHKVVIEVDGPEHRTQEDMFKDAKRTRFMKRMGYRVVRVASKRAVANPKGSAFLAFKQTVSADEFKTLLRSLSANLRFLASHIEADGIHLASVPLPDYVGIPVPAGGERAAVLAVTPSASASPTVAISSH